MQEKNEKNTKKDFHHQIYKLIVLLMLFTFIGLIIGFIILAIKNINKPENISNYDNEFNTKESIYKSNIKYYNKIKEIDIKNFIRNNNSSYINECDLSKFYTYNIYYHIPCIIKYNNQSNKEYKKYYNELIKKIKNKEKDLIKFNEIDKFIIYKKYFFINDANENNFKYIKAKVDDYAKLIINLDNNKNIKIFISPISQINEYKISNIKFNNEENSNFKILIDNNLKNIKNNNKSIIYEYTLNKGDLLYIPSFYFIQQEDKIDNAILFKYQDNSNIFMNIFSILYDINYIK